MKQGILVVDDDAIFADTLARSLARRGWQTWVANTIDQATELASMHQPSHAVIDLKIDQESGLTLLGVLKQHSPDIQPVILTGYSSIATTVSAMKLGAVNYVCKPANADEILAAFDSAKSSTMNTPTPTTPPSVRRVQWEHVQKVLEEHDGNITHTANALGMHRRTLQRFLQKKPVSH